MLFFNFYILTFIIILLHKDDLDDFLHILRFVTLSTYKNMIWIALSQHPIRQNLYRSLVLGIDRRRVIFLVTFFNTVTTTSRGRLERSNVVINSVGRRNKCIIVNTHKEQRDNHENLFTFL